MFLRIVTKYGLAAHLALLASLPVALTPFLGEVVLAETVLWLSAFSFIALIMSPSLRRGEGLLDARLRVLRSIAKDPFTWLFVTALAIAVIRWLNDGISLFYDAEKTVWLVTESHLGDLPGSVEGRGFLPFAMLLGLTVCVQGVRFGLGPKGRTWFAVASSTIVGIGALAASIMAVCGVEPYEDAAVSSYGAGPFWGSLMTSWLFVMLASAMQAESYKWGFAKAAFWIGAGGLMAGISIFLPPTMAVPTFAAALIFAIWCLVYVRRAVSSGAMARMLVVFIFAVLIPLLIYMLSANERVLGAKASQLAAEGDDGKVSEAVARVEETEAVLSTISKKIWLKTPWCGAGLGSFDIQLPFYATDDDWEKLPPEITLPSNSYWALLAEEGIVGASMLALLAAFLVAAWCVRLGKSLLSMRGNSDSDAFPFAVQPMVWIAPFVLAIMAIDARWSSLIQLKSFAFTLAVPIALSAASFPRPQKRKE